MGRSRVKTPLRGGAHDGALGCPEGSGSAVLGKVGHLPSSVLMPTYPLPKRGVLNWRRGRPWGATEKTPRIWWGRGRPTVPCGKAKGCGGADLGRAGHLVRSGRVPIYHLRFTYLTHTLRGRF